MAALFQPVRAGRMALQHRIAMSAMTRTRNNVETEAPTDLAVQYYRQRASKGGLLVSEGLAPIAHGRGYIRGGAIFSPAQVEGWKKVTDAVHEEGGFIVAQIMHAGRVSHSSLLPNGDLPVAPSAVQMSGVLRTPTGKQPYEVPRALATEEIPGVIAGIAEACERAVAAGFDGIELHGGNGYLIQEFLAAPTNQRTDQYGGSVENRCRFLLELIDAVSAAIGSDRVALKLQQGITFSDLVESEEDAHAQLEYLGPELSRRNMAYVCLSSLNGVPYCFAMGMKEPHFKSDVFKFFRAKYTGVLMINGGLNPATAEEYAKDNVADLVAFGNLFVANANLPALVKAGKELNMGGADPKTWYGLPDNTPEQDAQNYTDWPLVAC